MKAVRPLLLGFAVGIGAAAVHAEPVTLSGVKYEDAAEVRGAKVQLNGAGVRYKAVFKVYAAGLYLPRKAGTTEALAADDGFEQEAVLAVSPAVGQLQIERQRCFEVRESFRHQRDRRFRHAAERRLQLMQDRKGSTLLVLMARDNFAGAIGVPWLVSWHAQPLP